MFRKFGFALAAILALLVIFFPAFSKIQELKQENKELQEKIDKAVKENISLAEQNKNLRTDSFYVEKAAREKMGITKKGETIYRISPEE
ncbi:MAG: septum formation initiator family protein [Candidatus Omnitrophota bacterium]|nr:septum formation initiator family protein [Candidatus Omnitrophota bacterium]